MVGGLVFCRICIWVLATATAVSSCSERPSKGLTDELLAWQTELFLRLETHRDGYTVYVAPEAVVEIAFDGVQTSPRYPGGVALRFARVLRYRPDKRASDADDLDAVLAIHGGAAT